MEYIVHLWTDCSGRRRDKKFHVKGPWYSSQTWTYVVKFDKTFSLRWVWGQLMLPFISYGMKNDAYKGSCLWDLVHGAYRGSSLWDFTVARILRLILSNHYFFNLLDWWSKNWQKTWKSIYVSPFWMKWVHVCEKCHGHLIINSAYISYIYV